VTNNLLKPLVLIFYRGGWCPYCNLHLAELRHAEAKLIEMGYEVLFIGADLPEKLASSLQEKNISYTLLSDSKLQVSKAFGVAFRLDHNTLITYAKHGIDVKEASGEKHHMLPVPAVFVIGVDGIIRLQYVNPDYKVKSHPNVLLVAVRIALEHS
jgi:peroxiredoxin